MLELRYFFCIVLFFELFEVFKLNNLCQQMKEYKTKISQPHNYHPIFQKQNVHNSYNILAFVLTFIVIKIWQIFCGFPFINFFQPISVNFVFWNETFNYADSKTTNIADISNPFRKQSLSTPDHLSIVLIECICNVAVSRLFWSWVKIFFKRIRVDSGRKWHAEERTKDQDIINMGL